jgi:hypothetical protein
MGLVAKAQAVKLFGVGFRAERARFVFGDVSVTINNKRTISRPIADTKTRYFKAKSPSRVHEGS